MQLEPALPLPHVDGVQHRVVIAGGARFHVAEAGDGPPLVLLHGWPQHWGSWRHLIGPLAERHRVLCPDVRGLGWSSGANGAMSFDALADDLIAQLDELVLERVHPWATTGGSWPATAPASTTPSASIASSRWRACTRGRGATLP